MESYKFEPNIGNSLFPGFNDSQGIMLCGYEWGFSKNDQETLQGEQHIRNNVPHVFSNKAAEYGEKANGWIYDRRIIDWFELWGHKLNRYETGGDFEKCILQTNWCDTENNKMEGNYWQMLLSQDQIDNFINHIKMFKPRIIFFFGSQLIKILQHDKVLPLFQEIMGQITQPMVFSTKPFDGRKFNIGFQSFQSCKIVCLPHPSGAHGLTNNYIELFSPEIGKILQEFKFIHCPSH